MKSISNGAAFELKRMFPNASKSMIEANRYREDEERGLRYEEVHHPLAGKFYENHTPRQAKRKMNKTEQQFYLRLVADWPDCDVKFEQIKLKIGDKCWYTPDFMVITAIHRYPDGNIADVRRSIRFFEVKGGHIWDDSKVKFKAAQEQYPWFDFQMWQKKNKAWKQIL